MEINKSIKYDSIDIMRGIAILMVILVHTAQNVQGNKYVFEFIAEYSQMGVQMFFIASAFTLCNSLDRNGDDKYAILNFFIRRYFRIAPGYYLGILIYFILGIVYNTVKYNSVILPSQYNVINILINILFLNGLYPAANNNIVPGGWSIGTEMLFYLIIPVLFIICKSLQKKNIILIYIIPLASLGFTMIIEYIYCLVNNCNIQNNGFIYFSILNQFPVFCIGVSLYFIYKRNLLKNIKFLHATIGFFLFSGVSMYIFFNSKIFVLSFTVIPFISAISFIFVFIILQNNKIKLNLLSRIGEVSYSCYLLHFMFAVWITKVISKIFYFTPSIIILLVCYMISIVATFQISKITYKYIEQNGIKKGKQIIAFINRQILIKSNKVNAQ